MLIPVLVHTFYALNMTGPAGLNGPQGQLYLVYQSNYTLMLRLPVILKNSSSDSTLVSVRIVE